MKLAKVVKNRILHVWPWEKTLPDGTKVIKHCPYVGRFIKPRKQPRGPDKPLPDCIVEVPDAAKPGMYWDGKTLKPWPKATAEPKHDVLWDVVAAELGMTWEELKAEGLRHKNAMGTRKD